MRTIRIQRDDFDAVAESAALSAGKLEVGAVVTFTGIVRSDDGLSALALEHYPGMTEREIARHADEAKRRWPLFGVTIVHRIGRLRPGENIVLVAVASTRRKAAFEAAEFLVDYLKTRAPFWKQEERGSAIYWVEAKESDESAAARWNSV
ncbi:MAG TPA: molybdenum cofactor biosynthesis protein MoaE [Rhizomicrobium sp.]|jgi:molybdopterin synthase catalytic subunit|nr:molybdenum cofactor biosynthesis protein MoaE [Rhizomicrobium sp.]